VLRENDHGRATPQTREKKQLCFKLPGRRDIALQRCAKMITGAQRPV
jgi:hypothetical protein